ncbi:MAG: nucleotide-binding protein [Candidatus Woesearchaeota archaeon]|nr:nucleotide-binding protein [Candidatus Woesearchaeota archaeon]
MPETKKIILDTNFLLIPAQFGLDIFTELQKTCSFSYNLYIIDKSLSELDNIIRQQRGAPKKAAQMTQKLLKNFINNNKINIIPAKTGYIDREILDISDKDTLVATQDAGLRKKLREKGVKTIIMRQRKYLQIEG